MHDHEQWNAYWLEYRKYHRRKLYHLYEVFGFDGLDRNLKILDIGCGCGDFLDILASKGFRNIHGWEPQPQLVNASAIRSITVHDCLATGDQQDEYDVVVIFGVLHHLHSFREVQACIHNVFSLLKSGGQFFNYEQRSTVWRSVATALLLRFPALVLPTRFKLERIMTKQEKKELDIWLSFEKSLPVECVRAGFSVIKEIKDPLYRYLALEKV